MNQLKEKRRLTPRFGPRLGLVVTAKRRPSVQIFTQRSLANKRFETTYPHRRTNQAAHQTRADASRNPAGHARTSPVTAVLMQPTCRTPALANSDSPTSTKPSSKPVCEPQSGRDSPLTHLSHLRLLNHDRVRRVMVATNRLISCPFAAIAPGPVLLSSLLPRAEASPPSWGVRTNC
jgi:hypothetical protein